MSLITEIEQLNTQPRNEEEEYEYTSDFLEWFYYNICREQGFTKYPILSEVQQDPEFEHMKDQCLNLINCSKVKDHDSDALISKYESMKKWTIQRIETIQQRM
jgi:hypothetical protein